jgi:hypothetical protein
VDHIHVSSASPYSRAGVIYFANTGRHNVHIKCHAKVGFGYARPQDFYEPKHAVRAVSAVREGVSPERRQRKKSPEEEAPKPISKRHSRKVEKGHVEKEPVCEPIAIFNREKIRPHASRTITVWWPEFLEPGTSEFNLSYAILMEKSLRADAQVIIAESGRKIRLTQLTVTNIHPYGESVILEENDILGYVIKTGA